MNGYGTVSASRRRLRNATTRRASSAEPHMLSRCCGARMARQHIHVSRAWGESQAGGRRRGLRADLEKELGQTRKARNVAEPGLERLQEKGDEARVGRLLQQVQERVQSQLDQRGHRVPLGRGAGQPGVRRSPTDRGACMSQRCRLHARR